MYKYFSVNFFIALSGVLILGSCKQDSPNHEIKDKDLTIQVHQIKREYGENSGVSYAVRFMLSKRLRDIGQSKLNTDYWYHTDSCFYLQSGAKKTYASLVQPIANGVNGSLEYLLEFDGAVESGSTDLVYQDKFLTHKIYSLKVY